MNRLLRAIANASAALLMTASAQADSPAEKSATEVARRERSVAVVGLHKVTVGELEDRLAGVPLYQLATLDSAATALDSPSRAALARAYLEQVLVRDLVLVSGAETRGIDKESPTSELLAHALSNATLRQTRGAYASPADVPKTDIARYYDEHRVRFEVPERIHVWRILCAARDEALGVLEAARKTPTIAKFNELARVHSLDKATALRGGSLGFLAPDGVSNEAGVTVDKVLVTAARTVKDGEFVPAPVPEGNAFAVVWRRGTVAANTQSLEQAAAQIRATLHRESHEKAEKTRIEALRAEHLKEVHLDLLGILELRPFDAGLGLPRTVPTLPKREKP